MRSVHQFVTADEALMEAARAARRAARACRNWENGGPSVPVGDTAELALSTIDRALRNIREEDGVALSGTDPRPGEHASCWRGTCYSSPERTSMVKAPISHWRRAYFATQLSHSRHNSLLP